MDTATDTGMDLKGKRLLILGGSRISCEIVKHARAMGITTGVTDWYSLETSPAKQMADEAYFVSTSNIEEIVDLINSRSFDGVITGFTDSTLPYYAEICERAGLPAYGTKEQFKVFTDKTRYKKLLEQFEIPTIPEYNVDGAYFEEAFEKIDYPVIVKPADGSGSKGITVCHNQDELRTAIAFASETSDIKTILVEQYLDKPEVTIFWLFINGKYYMTLLGNRHIKHNQDGELPLPAGYTYPAKVQTKFLEETAPKMKRMFQAAGIKNGMMFMQCKVVDGQCVVYDIGYRLTGTLEYINLNALCGYDPMDMMIHFALTGNMGVLDIETKIDPYLNGKYAYNVSILCCPGEIAQITGIEEVRNLPGVIDVVVSHPEGDIITPNMKGRLAQITIRILGKADSSEQMCNDILNIQRMFNINSVMGENMILDGMDKNDFIGTLL